MKRAVDIDNEQDGTQAGVGTVLRSRQEARWQWRRYCSFHEQKIGLDGRLVHTRAPPLMSAWDGVTILWLNALNDLRVVFTLYFLT